MNCAKPQLEMLTDSPVGQDRQRKPRSITAKERDYKRDWARRNYRNHPEKCRAATRRSYEKHRETRRAWARQYYKDHPEECLASKRSYAKRYPERVSAMAASYRKRNAKWLCMKAQEIYRLDPERCRVRERARKKRLANDVSTQYEELKKGARRRDKVFDLTIEQFALFKGQPCFYCGDSGFYFGIDRVDNALGYTFRNLVSCCAHCNRAKRAQTQKEFIERCMRISTRHDTRSSTHAGRGMQPEQSAAAEAQRILDQEDK